MEPGSLQLPIFRHAYFDAVISTIRQQIKCVEAGMKPRHLLLVGPAGAGKTTILETIRNGYPPSRDTEGRSVPAAIASVPSVPTVKGLCEEVSSVLGDPNPTKGTESEMKIKLVKQLKGIGTRVLLLDEFQHFVDRSNRTRQVHVGDWVKLVSNETRVIIVACGLPRAQRVIEANEQLASRFMAPLMIPRLDWRFEHTRVQFMALVKAFSKHYNEPMLCDEAIAFRLYCATGGLLRSLANLVAYASMLATATRGKLASPSVLSQAYASVLFQRSAVVERPFDQRTKVAPTPDVLARIAQSMKVGDDPYDSADREPPKPHEMGLMAWNDEAT